MTLQSDMECSITVGLKTVDIFLIEHIGAANRSCMRPRQGTDSLLLLRDKALAVALRAPLNTMKTICRNLHCWVLPQEVSIANSGQAFDEDGALKDPALEERLLNLGRQLVKFASMRKEVQQSEFAQLWKSLPTW